MMVAGLFDEAAPLAVKAFTPACGAKGRQKQQSRASKKQSYSQRLLEGSSPPPPCSRPRSRSRSGRRQQRVAPKCRGRRKARREEAGREPSRPAKKPRREKGQEPLAVQVSPPVGAALEERLARLAEHLLSPAVRVEEPAEVGEVDALLTPEEVAAVFERHVPGVRRLLYREMRGVFALKFIVSAYQQGLKAFRGTPLHRHFTSLLRLLVHRGHEGAPDAAACLRELAEAFTDCQAVQARTIERLGLRARGVAGDFRALAARLVGEYKAVAVRMLASERISKNRLREDGNPVHYENRLTADLGALLGLDAADVRRAELDEHASARFPRLSAAEQRAAAARCRQLFDLEALQKALAAEVGGLAEDSPAESLPRAFLTWVSENLTDQHVVLDEDTCCRIEVGPPLTLAILEALFLGRPQGARGELYRGREVLDLFRATAPGSR